MTRDVELYGVQHSPLSAPSAAASGLPEGRPV